MAGVLENTLNALRILCTRKRDNKRENFFSFVNGRRKKSGFISVRYEQKQI